MAMFDVNEIAGDLRRVAIYWDKCGVEYEHRVRVLRRWADELEPPGIKCTNHCCDNDALFCLESAEDDDYPRKVSFCCGDHVAPWIAVNASYGSIKVDLL